MRKKTNKAFSLVELSIVILIIGVLVAAVGQGMDLLADARVSAARVLTQGSRVNGLKNLVVWYETTSEKSFDSAESVDEADITNWYDINPQATSKNNLQQNTLANKPKYVENCIGSLPCVRFDGTNDFMDSISSIGGISGGGLSVFAVVRFEGLAGAAEHSVVAAGSSWSPGYVFNLKGVFSNQIAFQNPNGSVPTFSSARNGTNYLIEAINYQSTASMWVNKVAVTPQAAPAMVSLEAINVGSFNNAAIGGRGRYLNGRIGEIIIFDRPVSEKERSAIVDYLSKKWKL